MKDGVQRQPGFQPWKPMAVLMSEEFKEEMGELEETRKAVENAENRARLEQRKTESKISRRNDREFAQALHREADQLYYRAANVFPRDSSHSVAARRTAATISSWNNPSRALGKLSPNVRTEARLTSTLCPESAAITVNEALKKSQDPSSISELLSYLDNHKHLWKVVPSPTSAQLTRSRAMVKQLNSLAGLSLKNLEASFNSGKMTAALKIAEELLTLSTGLREPSRYQMAAYRYLSLIHVSLGRHDRAVSNVSRLIRLSRKTGDIMEICRSLVTLGKVHLSFGHLEAAAKAWENLSSDLKEPIPLAWIQHEIGRCHLETGKYNQAMEMATKCVKTAEDGKSKKWLLRGKLLLGQSLAKLGRFADSLEELKTSAKITEEEGDTPMLSYVRDLIDLVNGALCKMTRNSNGYREIPETLSSTEKTDVAMFASRENGSIKCTFSSGKPIKDYHNESSSSEETGDLNEEITAQPERRLMQSYRGMQSQELRDEPGENECLTFRVASTKNSPRREDDLSLFSSSVDESEEEESSNEDKTAEDDSSNNDKMEEEESANDDKMEEEESANEDKIEAGKASDDESVRRKESAMSLKSDGTNLTYVISKDEDSMYGKTRDFTKLMRQEEAEISKSIVDKVLEERPTILKDMDGQNEGSSRNKDDLLDALRAIEQLDKNNEEELLEMLKDMLLKTEGGDRTMEYANIGNSMRNASPREVRREFERSRSCQDEPTKISTKHSLYRHSLPSSSRKEEVNLSSHPCEGRADVVEFY